MTKINLPKIDAIRAGASAMLGDDSVYQLKVCTSADILKDRSKHLVSNRTPVMLRKDGARWHGRLHQLPTCGFSESESVVMNDTARFASTGLFQPTNVDDEAVQTEKFYKANVLLQNALTREFCRRAVAGDDKPFSALSLMSEARKAGTPLNADFVAAAQAAPRGRAAGMLGGRLGVGDDVCQQLLGDFAIVGAVLVSLDGAPRGKATRYAINAAWRPALAEAAAINGALPPVETAGE